jgi:hypothetical protein
MLKLELYFKMLISLEQVVIIPLLFQQLIQLMVLQKSIILPQVSGILLVKLLLIIRLVLLSLMLF